MSYDPEAIKKQINQHQLVIDNLEKQKIGLDESIAKLQGEIDKLEQIIGLLDKVGK
jgi:prefoldin subunit 5